MKFTGRTWEAYGKGWMGGWLASFLIPLDAFVYLSVDEVQL